MQESLKKINEASLEAIKAQLGDLYEKYKDDAEKWANLQAKLQFRILMGENSESIKIAEAHAKFGLKCFLTRVRGDIEENSYNILSSILEKLIAMGIQIARIYITKGAI